MRELKINKSVALLLAALRREEGIDEVHDLRIEDVLAVEEKYGLQIPDPILAFYASGLAGRFATTRTSPAAMIGLTQGLRGEILDLIDQGYRPEWSYRQAVAFDYDNGNYLAFRKGTGRTSDAILFVDHEAGGFVETPAPMTLREYLDPEEKVTIDDDLEPFTARFFSKPDDPPEEEPELIVEHGKFGRGRVVERDETGAKAKWNVEFEDGTTRKLLADFLTPV
jgi:hypothetical protein